MSILIIGGLVIGTGALMTGISVLGNWLFDKIYNHNHNKRYRGKRFYFYF